MTRTKIFTLTIAILIISLACGPTLIIADPTPDGRTAPPAASTPLLITEGTPFEHPEDDLLSESPAGAVFEVPQAWTEPQPTATPRPSRGRSNYQ